MSSIVIKGITTESLESKSDYTPIPAGKYQSTIFNVKLEEVKSGENAGKPRFNIQFKITGPEHENRRVFSLVPLYVAKDFWKAQSFFKALGYDIEAGDFSVPDVNELLGKALTVTVKIGADQNGEPRNEVSGFGKADDSASSILSSMGATATESPWVN